MSGNYPGDGSPSIASAFYNQGTALGQNLSVGTADNYQLTIITNGTTAVTVDTSQNVTVAGTLTVSGATVFTGVLEAPNGTAAAPSFTFASDLDTGLYRSAANQVGVAVGGANVGTFFSAGLQLPVGAVGAPSLTFTDSTTGFYRTGTNEFAIANNGVLTAKFVANAVSLAAGAVGAPSLTVGDSTTGFYKNGTNGLSVTNAGVLSLTCDATNNVIVGSAQLAQNATAGFFWLPTCATGKPNGTPSPAPTGRAAMVYDVVAHKIAVYENGVGWVETAALT